MDWVEFGFYQGQGLIWQVLEISEDTALITTVDIIDSKPYNRSIGPVTWGNCTLRAWLNNEFYFEAFNENLKKHIIMSHTLCSIDSMEHETSETSDNVFILSAEETAQYFTDNDSRTALFPNKALACDEEDTAGIRKTGQWWLRADSVNIGNCHFAPCCDHEGKISSFADTRSQKIGVRPAMRVYTSGLDRHVIEDINNLNLRLKDPGRRSLTIFHDMIEEDLPILATFVDYNSYSEYAIIKKPDSTLSVAKLSVSEELDPEITNTAASLMNSLKIKPFENISACLQQERDKKMVLKWMEQDAWQVTSSRNYHDQFKIGSLIELGHFVSGGRILWRILEIQGNKALVFAVKSLGTRQFVEFEEMGDWFPLENESDDIKQTDAVDGSNGTESYSANSKWNYFEEYSANLNCDLSAYNNFDPIYDKYLQQCEDYYCEEDSELFTCEEEKTPQIRDPETGLVPDPIPYNSSFSSSVTWQNSTVREYLNETFLYNCFTEFERGVIVPCNTKEGALDDLDVFDEHQNQIIDRCFLLSSAEASIFFPNNASRRLKEESTGKAVSCEWWLRTLNCYESGTAFVDENGRVHQIDNIRPDYPMSIFPAMIIDLSKYIILMRFIK